MINAFSQVKNTCAVESALLQDWNGCFEGFDSRVVSSTEDVVVQLMGKKRFLIIRQTHTSLANNSA